METIALPEGHIILPLEIRRRLGIETGMRLEVDFDDKTGCIRLHPLDNEYVNVLQNGERKKRRHQITRDSKSL